MTKLSKREKSSFEKKSWAKSIYQKLSKLYPDAHCELNFSNPLELLFATILSAQCTDTRVNIVTKILFTKCKNLEDYLKLKQKDLEEIIKSTGFFRSKAQNILAAAKILKEKFNGEVPRSLEELITLPGVGRKTANVVLGNGFSLPGLPVDTHVKRLVNRIGICSEEDPVKIESELCAMIQPKDWALFSLTLIFHGRRVCKARKPACNNCPITDRCIYYNKQL